jgi:hydrogenase/urease accessory protein HupE
MKIRENTAWRVGLALCVCVLLRPSDAAAHLVTTGMGPVYDGIGHLLLTPEDLVPVLTLALFAGLRGTAQGRHAMFLLPVAWLAGGLLGLQISAAPAFPVPALSFLILGALVAADLRLPANGVAVLAVVLGLVHGVLNGAALRQGAGGLGLLGIMAALFVLVTLGSAFVVSLERPWARIAVRVAGSWIAASGILLLGWAFRG